ncbi:MAG: dehydrogenase, partial [Mucilaginibacter polytrichastri]|nr:dehydrogenase [Mucilaginibacter polytrichastri]
GKIHLSPDRTAIWDPKGKEIFKYQGKGDPNPYQTEHDVLFAAVSNGEYKFWDAERGAKSTMTSILGRLATYSGKVVTWDEAFKSDIKLAPDTFTWETEPKSKADANGMYPAAIPGKTKVV